MKTIYRLFLKDLFKWVGHQNVSYNGSDGTGKFYIEQDDGSVIERDFYSFGYSDINSQDIISGSTFGLAYVTEGIFCNEDFHKQLLARLSIKGSRLFGDTNPSGPHHWLWANVINNPKLLERGSVKAFPFNFDSNYSLDPQYKEDLKQEYGEGSIWYQRLILGLWVMAEGIVYKSFDQVRNTCTVEELPQRFDELFAALDYGTTNPFNVGLFGTHRGITYQIDEYDHDGRKKGPKTNGQYLGELAAFFKPYCEQYNLPISAFYVDPSCAGFKADMADTETDDEDHQAWRELNIPVIDADNDVSAGIQTVYGILHKGLLVICKRCYRALSEFHLYSWNMRASLNGKDEPIKKDDHAMDMIRYALQSRRKSYDPYAGFGIPGMR